MVCTSWRWQYTCHSFTASLNTPHTLLLSEGHHTRIHLEVLILLRYQFPSPIHHAVKLSRLQLHFVNWVFKTAVLRSSLVLQSSRLWSLCKQTMFTAVLAHASHACGQCFCVATLVWLTWFNCLLALSLLFSLRKLFCCLVTAMATTCISLNILSWHYASFDITWILINQLCKRFSSNQQF